MAQLFKRILCPIDFDDNSTAALEVAVALANQNGAALSAVHVVSVPASGLGYPIEPYDRLGATERKKLEALIGHHVPADLAWRAIVKVGNPAEEIIATAEEVEADLIVMATHGRAGVTRLLLGSVAERVIRGSSRPVLAVRSEPEAARTARKVARA